MMTKKVSFLLAALVILVFSSSATAAIPVEVSVGKGTIVTLKKVSERVSISDPAVADMVLISPTEILLNGKKIGTTTLIVWDKEGKRTFFDLFVVGDLSDLIEKIKALAPEADITVEMAKDAVYLRGDLENEETIKKILTISQAYAPKVINFLRVKEAQQVMLEVKVAQIDRSKLKELGLSFLVKGNDAEGTSPGFIASPTGTLGGDAGFDVTPGIEGFELEDVLPQIGVSYFPSGVSVFLRALVANGLGKVLAEPDLLVRSGEEGEFLVGTRVPIQSTTGAELTPTITFEEVGIKLNFAPEVLETGVIRLKIDPAEVSNISQFINIPGSLPAPVIDTREVSTSVDLKEDESLILAGLLNEETRKNIQKVPILGDIPILGAIFRSTRDEIEETELAFFITPRLVKPMAPGERPELPGERPLTPEEEREFQWIPMGGGKTETGEKEVE
jgi:pilus assembly protein CpaC